MSLPIPKRGLYISASDLNDILFALESSRTTRPDHARISKLVLKPLTQRIKEQEQEQEKEQKEEEPKNES